MELEINSLKLKGECVCVCRAEDHTERLERVRVYTAEVMVSEDRRCFSIMAKKCIAAAVLVRTNELLGHTPEILTL